jgi:hypothetical protein
MLMPLLHSAVWCKIYKLANSRWMLPWELSQANLLPWTLA